MKAPSKTYTFALAANLKLRGWLQPARHPSSYLLPTNHLEHLYEERKVPMKRSSSFRVVRIASAVFLGITLLANPSASATPIQVYGTWHCSNDQCTWGTVRDMADFDPKKHSIIDRGYCSPSLNLVLLSFVNSLRLVKQNND